jgi:hypothetical protein
VFRTKQNETSQPTTPDVAKESAKTSTTSIEVPFMDYEVEHSKPFSVDYFQLGDTWQDPDGGFETEVTTIEKYLQDRIKSGEIANSMDAVKEVIKGVEKITNMKKEERPVVKISVIANYMRFLMDNDKIMSGLKHYANT